MKLNFQDIFVLFLLFIITVGCVEEQKDDITEDELLYYMECLEDYNCKMGDINILIAEHIIMDDKIHREYDMALFRKQLEIDSLLTVLIDCRASNHEEYCIIRPE